MTINGKSKRVELRLTNGKKVLGTFDIEKIYNVEERNHRVASLISKFPFVKISKIPYVYFRYMTTYDTITSCEDAAYKVDCNLVEFCKLLDISFSSFSEAKLRTAIEEG